MAALTTPGRARLDRLSAPGRDLDYRLTQRGAAHLSGIGVATPDPGADGTAGLRYCVDWTEQRHHLAGDLGRSLCATMVDRGWIVRAERSRAVRVTDAGRGALRRWFGIAWLPPSALADLPSPCGPSGPVRPPGVGATLS